MPNPYPANIMDGGGNVRTSGYVAFTDPANQPGNGGAATFKRERATIAYADFVDDEGGSAQAPLYTLADGEVILFVAWTVTQGFDDAGAGGGMDIVDDSFVSLMALSITVTSTDNTNTNWRQGEVGTMTTNAAHNAFLVPAGGANAEATDAAVPFQMNFLTYTGDGNEGEIVVDLYIFVPPS